MNQVKLFTPQEANKTLPLVRRIVGDILAVGQKVREEDPPIHALLDQLDELFDELETLGCSYKDWNFSVGLVDFPAVVHQKEVFLCWKSDEEAVMHYHGVEEGFAGRRPIPKELL